MTTQPLPINLVAPANTSALIPEGRGGEAHIPSGMDVMIWAALMTKRPRITKRIGQGACVQVRQHHLGLQAKPRGPLHECTVRYTMFGGSVHSSRAESTGKPCCRRLAGWQFDYRSVRTVVSAQVNYLTAIPDTAKQGNSHVKPDMSATIVLSAEQIHFNV